jgi:hypothetical protein
MSVNVRTDNVRQVEQMNANLASYGSADDNPRDTLNMSLKTDLNYTTANPQGNAVD